MMKKSPRIFTYKITFEEVPYWYWGVHKEKYYNDGYMGSPVTNKWVWEFYTPKIQILEFFPFTDEGWEEANLVEDRLIRPDLDKTFCLNEHCGGRFSLDACRKSGKKVSKKLYEIKNKEGKCVHSIEMNKKLHEMKYKDGKSIHAVKIGKIGGKIGHEKKDEIGRSVLGVKNAERLHKEKNCEGKSVNAVKGGKAVGKEAAKVTNSQIWESLMDGFRSTPSSVAKHNKANGWDPAARVRVAYG